VQSQGRGSGHREGSLVIARPKAVAIHAFRLHGLPRFARNDGGGAVAMTGQLQLQ